MKDEMNEVIDEDFNVLEIVSRDEIVKRGLRHKVALVIVVNSENKFYVNQRTKTKKLYPLKWVVGAGGGVVAGESFEDAAKRELEEELGIICPVKFLFDFDYESKFNNYKAKVYLAKHDGQIELNKDECKQGKWASVNEVKKLIEENMLCPDTALFVSSFIEEYFEI